jgi:molybdenum cofactor cytidylyltransferase
MTTGAGGRGALEAIVLAAGAGVRFGGPKLTTPWRGGTLLDGALAAALTAPVRGVWVVSGADPGVFFITKRFAAAQGLSEKVRLVRARDHAEGMAASLRAGLEALPPDAAGVFVFLGDMPRIPPGLTDQLAKALGRGAPAAAPVYEGQRGHPVLFGAELFDELASLEGDIGAREVLDRLGSQVALVQTPDPGILFDVDEPGDLNR